MFQVSCGDTVRVDVQLKRASDEEEDESEEAEGSAFGKVVCPRYPSDKLEGWWLVVGNSSSNELLSIKRISIGRKSTKVRLQPPSTLYHHP
jgi:pre-mRNA-splicing helicase BRR2